MLCIGFCLVLCVYNIVFTKIVLLFYTVVFVAWLFVWCVCLYCALCLVLCFGDGVVAFCGLLCCV